MWQLWLPGHQLGRGAAPWLDPYSFQPEVEARVNFAGWPFAAVFGPLKALFGTVVAWNLFVLLGYLGAGGLTFLWLRSIGLGVGASLAGGLVFALAPYRAVQGGAGHLLAWIAMLLPLSLWAWERRLYWLTAAALATIPLSGQVHLALGALPFVFAYALVRGGDRRWAGGALAAGLAAGVLVWAVSIRGSIGSSRSFAQVERYSAELADFVSRDPRHGLEAFVFIGWLVPLLALLGFVLHRRTGLGLVLGARGAASDGARPRGQSSGLRGALGDVPGLGVTRVPGRLMVIAGLALAGLAAFGLEWVLQRRRGLAVLGAALVLLAVDLRAGVTAVPADRRRRRESRLRGAGTRGQEGACSRCPSTRPTARRRASTSTTRCRRRASGRPATRRSRRKRRPEYSGSSSRARTCATLPSSACGYLAVYGPSALRSRREPARP